MLLGIVQHLARFFAAMGGFGLFVFGILDSSFFLFLPLGNDLLMVALTARHHERMVYYAAMATAGSAAGVFLTEFIVRKGEERIEKRFSSRRLAYVRRQVEKRAAPALALASIMPPPFPFTVFIVAAAALHYPRPKLLGVVGAFRFTRFLIEGALAIHYGRGILRLAQTPVVQNAVFAIMVICIAGSAWSIYGWVRKSKT